MKKYVVVDKDYNLAKAESQFPDAEEYLINHMSSAQFGSLFPDWCENQVCIIPEDAEVVLFEPVYFRHDYVPVVIGQERVFEFEKGSLRGVRD